MTKQGGGSLWSPSFGSEWSLPVRPWLTPPELEWLAGSGVSVPIPAPALRGRAVSCAPGPWAVRLPLPGRCAVVVPFPPASSPGRLTGIAGEGESQMGLFLSSGQEASLCSQLLPKRQLSGEKSRSASATWAPTVCGTVSKEESQERLTGSQRFQGAWRSPHPSWVPSSDGRLTPFPT